MDGKTWLWRKKSSEKTIVATDKAGVSLKQINQEEQLHPMEEGRDRIVKNLNEKLASIVLDNQAKDELVTENMKMAPVANPGREMAEADAISLKKELDEALRQGKLLNEKLTHSEVALKECMQQLDFVRDEQERRIHDAVAKTSSEFEKAQKALRDELTETYKRLEELTVENSRLSKALLVKEKLIEDQQKHKSQSEAEFGALMDRLDLTEKENAFLKYEFHVLEKELEIKNEEMEYNRRATDLAHKQHLHDVKKIGKLEAECQRLRLLLQKRLPGPAAVVKMKNEVELLGKNKPEMRRTKLNPTRDLILRGSTAETSPENPTKNINILLEKLQNVEEENKALKEIMAKNNAQIQSLSLNRSQTSFKRTTEVEIQPKELFEGQKSMELVRCSPISSELSMTSGFDIGSIDGNSSLCSWANTLFSESAQSEKRHRNPMEHKAITVPEMRLMDDFAEMEKLALSDVKELVPFEQGHGGFGNTKQIQARDVAGERSFDWLQVVLQAISEHKRTSNRSLVEILEDIKIALGCSSLLNTPDVKKTACLMHPVESDSVHISGYIAWKSPNASPTTGSLGGASSVGTPTEKTKQQQFQSNLTKSISKIIELIEGIGLTSPNSSDSCQEKNQTPKQSPAHSDYFVRVFQWKSSELSTVLQHFICTCNDLLNRRADLDTFAEELSFALDWIVNYCVTPKEASSARDKIKRYFGWNDPQSEKEVAQAGHGLVEESDVTYISEEQPSVLDSFASSLGSVSPQKEGITCSLEDENKRLKDDLKDMETRLETANDKSEALTVQLRESKESIGSLQAELNMLKESKEMIEDQVENQKSINEDLDTQLTVVKAKLNEIFQKCSSLEVELEYKNSCCEELEATCLELQLQLESVAEKETPKYVMNQEGKQSQNGWQITSASVKLAECQETIMNLGKQLKVLATPHDAVLVDKVFSNSNSINNRRINKRLSLRDRMLADDGGKADVLNSPKSQGTEAENSTLPHSDNYKNLQASALLLHTSETRLGSKKESTNAGVMALAIVPSKKKGVGLLRRLLFRRKKGYSKKARFQN